MFIARKAVLPPGRPKTQTHQPKGLPVHQFSHKLTRAAVSLVIEVDVDGVLAKVPAELLALLLLQGVAGDDLKGLLHVDGFLGRGLKVGDAALRLAKGHGALGRDDALALLDVDLVAQHDKGERIRVAG